MEDYGDVKIDVGAVPSPCYVCDRDALRRNLKILASVQERSGCKVLLALKGFAMFSLFQEIRPYAAGISASSLDEARLGFEEFGGELHVYCPAYQEDEFSQFVDMADHIVFNSFSQWRRFRAKALSASNLSCGIRINPEYSEIKTDVYNPCVRYSRLGVPAGEFAADQLDSIEGLHFHALCEQNADTLVHTLAAVEERFESCLGRMKWVNFGGGHHITRSDYDVDLLCKTIIRFRKKYGVEVYLEPGEAVALNVGVLVATILDIVYNEMHIAILDTSAAAHMPDVLEMPYRPEIAGAGPPGQYPYTYRLGGLTCLAGDIIGDYSFQKPLCVGQRLVFFDMAHYTMVKNTTFNGVRLPGIAIFDPATKKTELIREFGYEDYKSRLS